MTYLALDQYGQTHKLYSNHPRKELLEKLGRKHADKMYIGDGEHIGYIISGLWLEVYKCERMSK